MSRIFWDTMLFIYLMDNHPVYSNRVRQLLNRSYRRGDCLLTSYLALGEIVAGAEKSPNRGKAAAIRSTIEEMGFSFLSFGDRAVRPFSSLRAKEKVKVADAIHLACAASSGVDLFMTGDKDLMRLDVPGIQFIADFNSPIL
jgi:predicted nucleic acid-binding protein